jgi:asparagine synthase (glutamine-hydrolysing)
MAMNIRLKGANLILVKVDKMTSANGILALPPLFCRKTIETSLACPPRLKLDGNIEKAILKKAVEDIVPRPIVERPKSGMMVPVRYWFREDMRTYARKVLTKRNLDRMGLFNTAYVRKLLDYDVSDMQGMRHGMKLWMLITFMIWYEQMIEAHPARVFPESHRPAGPLWTRMFARNRERKDGSCPRERMIG